MKEGKKSRKARWRGMLRWREDRNGERRGIERNMGEEMRDDEER